PAAENADRLARGHIRSHPAGSSMNRSTFLRHGAALFGLLTVFSSATAQEPDKPELLVFAASSLTNVLGEQSQAFEKKTGATVKLPFAASSALARQIENGAAADVFVSADQEWMNYLDERKLIAAGTRRDLVGNRLVLIAPADSKAVLKIEPGF